MMEREYEAITENIKQWLPESSLDEIVGLLEVIKQELHERALDLIYTIEEEPAGGA